MRAWYRSDMSLGLLYECHRGAVRPDSPRALVQNRGTDFMEVIPIGDGSQLPLQPPEVRWQPTHEPRGCLLCGCHLGPSAPKGHQRSVVVLHCREEAGPLFT